MLESFRDTGGIERAMDYIFYQVAAVNGFDSVGHYLRAGLLVNACTTYAVAPVPGCSAKFPVNTASASANGSGETNAIDAAGSDPVLRATAIALAKALGQEVEKARKQQAAAPKPKDKAAKQQTQRKPSRGGGKPKPEEEIPEAIPTIDPSAPEAPTPAPSAAPAAPPRGRAGPAATCAPAAPTADAGARGPGRRAAGLPLRR